ncbi:MAG: hypothetical protein Phyf2KO_03000 [Phycisphaerales bacterium]
MLKEWYRSKRLAVEKQIAYLHKLRLRAFGIVVGLGLATLGLLSMSILPTLPVVVGAFAVAALVVNKVAAQLSNPVCIGCGTKLDNEPLGQYGVICPKCGTISASAKSDALELPASPDDESDDEDEQA